MAVLRDRASSDDACAMARQKQLSPRMAAEQRDVMLPRGWVPGAEFRLENIDGGDHLFYMELFEGFPHMPTARSFLQSKTLCWMRESRRSLRIVCWFRLKDVLRFSFCSRGIWNAFSSGKMQCDPRATN